MSIALDFSEPPVRICTARNLIERFLNKIKQRRRVATRYDKRAANYLASVKLASIRIWLRANPRPSETAVPNKNAARNWAAF